MERVSMDIEKDVDQDELKKAYEADKERRSASKDEELKAAQDYLGVLLEEIENKNAELEEKKKEAGMLADALMQSEQENEIGKKKDISGEAKKVGSVWFAISIIEALAIIALIVCSVLIVRSIKKEYENSAKDEPKPTTAVENNTQEVLPTPVPEPLTAKHVENLEELAAAAAQDMKDFTCSVETIDGLEYLVYSNGDIKVAYKNEYYLSDKSFRKVVLLEQGDKRTVRSYGYDFGENLKLLCPRECRIGNRECYVLTDYAGPGRIPDTLRVVDASTLNEYYGDDIRTKISNLMTVGFSSENTGLDYAPMLLELKTSKASYKYGIEEAEYNDITYNDYALDDIDNWFSMEIGDEGITWRTVVWMGEKYCLGELNGSLELGADSVYVDGARFGAYVPANQEDPELNGVIIPTTLIPERYLTINGQNSERYYVTYNENIPPCTYDWTKLDTTDKNNWIYYDENKQPVSIRGIDVSKYQGDVDWKKVAEAGVEFVIVRMGFRGMNEGTLEVDPYFKKNVEGALKAGLKVGIYFFSQAVNEKEAVEEADFVLEAIKTYNITYPVIFDTERVATYDARANSISYAQRTANTIAFCDRVAEAGYTPMIYANTKYMVMGIDLEALEKYEKWFAVYSDNITFPYHFSMLQYSESGSVPGITGNVDLNISFVDYSKK